MKVSDILTGILITLMLLGAFGVVTFGLLWLMRTLYAYL